MRRISPCLCLLWPVCSWASVVINEVAFDQPAGSPDWVELFNTGPAAQSVEGWTLDDEDAAEGNEVLLSFPAPIPAGAFLVVYVDAAGPADGDFSDGKGVFYSGTATTVSLAATEDELALRSPSRMEDFVAWAADGHYDGAADQAAAAAAGLWTSGAALLLEDAGSGYSIGRAEDGADADVPGDFLLVLAPTPGASNAAPEPPAPPPSQSAAPREVVINEVAWGGTAASSTHEWIELFNNTGRAVSLDGWRMTGTDLDVALSGTLAPGGYYLMERTSDAPLSSARADLVYSGALSNGGEDLILTDAAGHEVDALRFSGGWPAGTGAPDYRSMERVVPSAEGGLSFNWRSNDGSARSGSDAKGAPLNATPGSPNSVFSPFPLAAESPRGAAFSVDPSANPFSPRDPDPARRSARLIFDAGSPEAVKLIRLCDVRGQVVRSFTDADGLAGISAGFVLWDGSDEEGRPMPAGLYIAHFEAAEPGGGRRSGRGVVVLGYPR